MDSKFRRQYPRGTRTAILPLDFVISAPPAWVPRAASESLVIGFLSNLTIEKGLRRAFETLEALTVAGIAAELLVAGPLRTAAASGALHAGLQRSRGKARYVGPLADSAKDAFFESVDIFIFPSKYSHESFGIVVREALIHGVPTISYECGCLEQAALGSGAIVLNRGGVLSHERLEIYPHVAFGARPTQLSLSGGISRRDGTPEPGTPSRPIHRPDHRLPSRFLGTSTAASGLRQESSACSPRTRWMVPQPSLRPIRSRHSRPRGGLRRQEIRRLVPPSLLIRCQPEIP